MGARIKIADRTVTIEGVQKLQGAPVDGLDIRAAASLVLAGLAAEGETQVHEPSHLRRGYEHLERKMGALGARLWARLSDPDDFIFAGC
jgi:UDP-N-acetylglucosamine 1-carboxyvinyltransferase